MIVTHRVSMAFAKFRDNRLGFFGRSVLLALTNNPHFPNLPVSLADLAAAVSDYSDAFVKNRIGGYVATAKKNQARAQLISVLRDEAHYVQSTAKNNLPALLSSGFTAIDRNTAPAPLVRPVIKKLDNQVSTQLRLLVQRVPNARMYQVRWKVGGGDWQDAGAYTKARTMVLNNLTPGTVYVLQVRALGGSTGHGDWSLAVTKMAT